MPRGRPKGVKDSKPRMTAARKMAGIITADGIMPLEVMMTLMRQRWDERDYVQALAIANMAAPYCHAKLANTTVNANVTHDLASLSDGELAHIALGGGEGAVAAAKDSRQLN